MTNWDVVLDALEEYDKDTTPLYGYPTPTGGEGVLVGRWSPWPAPARHRRPPVKLPASWRELGWVEDD